VSGTIDGTALLSVQGLPITREWSERDMHGRTEDGVEIKVTSKSARAILVIEKEGVYTRLSEERIFDRFPCILVTGKGFPDLATRALVSTLHRELNLPVIGLCDCNPFGISVLALYHYAGERMGIDGRKRYTVPMRWLGLRPSKVAELKDELPDTVFQKLSDLDYKRITSLLDSGNPFLTEEDEEEVRIMGDSGYKVELEALYWLGSDYMGNWVVRMLKDGYD
jgi:meiotic recombination protein SPO11